ncbi:unnamed protein product, partial [marine sediment metagenome]
MKALIKKKPKMQDLKKLADINTGDFVLGDRGEIFKVGKKTKKGFNILHEFNGDWNSYGDIALEDFEWKYLKITKPLEELEEEVFDKIKNLKAKKEEISDSTSLAIYDKNHYLTLKKNCE